jgi:hypothetical protein
MKRKQKQKKKQSKVRCLILSLIAKRAAVQELFGKAATIDLSKKRKVIEDFGSRNLAIKNTKIAPWQLPGAKEKASGSAFSSSARLQILDFPHAL